MDFHAVKAKTRVQIFVSAIASVVAWFAAVQDIITQFADNVKMRLVIQLIKGIPRIFQKLLKFFNGTIISTFSVIGCLFSLIYIFLN